LRAVLGAAVTWKFTTFRQRTPRNPHMDLGNCFTTSLRADMVYSHINELPTLCKGYSSRDTCKKRIRFYIDCDGTPSGICLHPQDVSLFTLSVLSASDRLYCHFIWTVVNHDKLRLSMVVSQELQLYDWGKVPELYGTFYCE